MKASALFCALGVVMALGGTETVSAQEEVPRPNLGGHTFLEHVLFPGAFVQTSMRNTLGVGRALNVETLPPIQIDTLEFGGKRGNLYFATLSLGYQHAVTDWLALGAQFGLAARLGDGVNTILAQGATMNFAFDLGARFRLYEGESTYLSTGISLKRDNVTVIDFRSWVQGIVEDEEVPLVGKRPSTRPGIDLAGAWAPADWIGLQGFAGVSLGDNLEAEQESDWYNSFGASADFDLLSVSSIPVGFVVGGRRDTFPRSASDLAEAVYGWLFRIAYTGRNDFVVGLDLTMDRVPLREGGKLEAGSVQFSTRYYF
jgi:hypothetical protein